MSGRCEGRIVVVTGAARGQGAAEVEALVADGAVVVATDVLDDEGEALVDGLAGSDGGQAVYRHLDVTSAEEWAALAEWLRDTYEGVDGLVNNAGVPARGRLPDVDLEVWERTFRINATGPMLGMKYLVPLMGDGASIVNICSVAAMSGHVAAPYTASKWALRGLSRSASLELGPRGIRVNAVMPGLVDTPMMEGASPAFAAAAIADTPLGRMASADEIAPLIVYLISTESSYMTGAEITIDGGLIAHGSHKRIADAIAPAEPPSPTMEQGAPS